MLVSGVGTGGTITGVGEVIKARKPGFKCIARRAAASPVLSGGSRGRTRFRVSARASSPRCSTAMYDEIIQSRRGRDRDRAPPGEGEGLLVGISAGRGGLGGARGARRPGARGKLIVVIIPSRRALPDVAAVCGADGLKLRFPSDRRHGVGRLEGATRFAPCRAARSARRGARSRRAAALFQPSMNMPSALTNIGPTSRPARSSTNAGFLPSYQWPMNWITQPTHEEARRPRPATRPRCRPPPAVREPAAAPPLPALTAMPSTRSPRPQVPGRDDREHHPGRRQRHATRSTKAGRASSTPTAKTIIGTPMKWLTMLRRSRWY